MSPAGRGESVAGVVLGLAAATSYRKLLLIGLLVGAAVTTASGQTITFNSGSPSLTIAYDWTIAKSVGGAQGSLSGTTFTVQRGKSLDLPYTITITRTPSGTPTATMSFSVNCPTVNTTAATSVIVTPGDSGSVLVQSQLTSPTVQFSNIAWTKVPSSPTETAQGSIVATCTYPVSTGGGSTSTTTVKGDPVPVIFSANTQEIRASAQLTDTVTWPTWSTWFSGMWLTTPPSTIVTQGTYPSQGVTVKGSTSYSYTWTVSNIMLCFGGATVTNKATLTAGTGADQRTYSADASASITVTDCDVKPTFTIDQPNLQTTLTYAWSQSLAASPSAAITVPWGGGGNIDVQGTFTRSVTSATFQASFTVQITNPVAAPIAITNLQLSCPWGGNVLLPCGGVVGGGATGLGNWGGGQASLMVIPASGSTSCIVNNLVLTATWGTDFTQPCTILTSNWLGTQVTYQGLVLNFQGPQRLITYNNCVQWSVTCSVPTGNAFFVPSVGTPIAAQQLCGNENGNAPMPPQRFSVAFSGGWIGDGTQPAACTSAVSTTCTSNLLLQNTQGTTQAFGGAQAATISLQAMPMDCPKPPPAAPTQLINGGTAILLPSPAPLTTKMVDPVVTAAVTRTYIRGTFTWAINTRLTPSSLAIAPGPQGVLGRFSVSAAPQPVAGATDPAQYQLEGVVTVSNPDPVSSVRVDEVFVVVDNAAVPLGCRPTLPGVLQPGARVDCGFMVNYNQGGNPNSVLGRATVVSDWGVRRSVESVLSRFSFDNSEVSGARGACARVAQTFATNWFDLQQVTGVAPSFDSANPTTVCSPANWNFDVRFTTRENPPCGSQQVLQTVTAVFLEGAAGGSAQGSSAGNLYITGAGCPPAPAGFGAGDILPPATDTTAGGFTPGPGPSGFTPVPGAGGSSSGSSGGSTVGGGSSSSTPGGLAVPGATSADALEGPPPPGLSVALSGVQAQRSATPNWDLTMAAVADNVTLTRGVPAAVSFRINWEKTKPATDYSGTLTIFNNAASAAELDAVVVNLMDSMAGGDAVAEVQADCPVGTSGVVQPVTASNTITVPANGRLACNFTLKSASSGSLVATITLAAGGDGIVSKATQVASLMQDSNCGRLLTGLAASELSANGVLKVGNGTSEEDVCTTGSRLVTIPIPADALTSRGCVFPVVALAYIKPQQSSSTGSGTLASAQVDVLIAGCSSQFGGQTAASIDELSVSKGRALRWVVDIATRPAVNGTFMGESLAVNTTWQQRSDVGLRLNVSGVVAVQGTAAATTAKVLAIPFCTSDNATDCTPVALPADCKASADSKDASSCVFNFTRLPNQPGLLLPIVSQAAPAAAQAYDPARARYGGRPTVLCAVLSEEHRLTSPDGAAAAKAIATGATPLPSEAFCGAQQSLSYTLAFDGIECGTLYNFTARATAVPVGQGAVPVGAQLAFNVTCL